MEKELDRPVLAIEVDHTLAESVAGFIQWHGTEYPNEPKLEPTSFTNRRLEYTSSDANNQSVQDQVAKYYESNALSEIQPVPSVEDILRPFGHYFRFVAFAFRPRSTEVITREWLDNNYSGIFERLILIDDVDNNLVPHLHAVFSEYKVRVVMTSDSNVVDQVASTLDHLYLVNPVPWLPKDATKAEIVDVLSDWTHVKDALDSFIKEKDLPERKQLRAGPKLAKLRDDLVLIHTFKPAGIYATIISSKFTVHRMDTVHVHASEDGMSSAIQAVEMVNEAKVVQISTSSGWKWHKNGNGRRTPRLQFELRRK